jgi:[protein-PII] uridylyltransferase
VLVDNEASAEATILEVHAVDAVGVLYRIAAAIAGLGLDIRHAKVSTLGPEVIDTFYVLADGEKLAGEERVAAVTRSLLEAGTRPPPSA